MLPEIRPIRASIEVGTTCNHRCQYCPVTEFPKPREVMSLDLFTQVIGELGGLGNQFRRISFSHYNETLLDPLLVDRIQIAHNLSYIDYLLIFSNLSILPRNLTKDLEFAKERIVFNVNLPTTDRERYKRIHGFDHYLAVDAHIHELIQAGFNVKINAQKNAYTTDEDVEGVARLYGNKAKVSILKSDDRSGLVAGFARNRHEGLIKGCSTRRAIDYVHVGVNGEVFLCCQDYFKRYRFGNIQESSLAEILSSPQARRYLGYIYGERVAPNDFICRNCEFAVTDDNEGI